MDRVRKAIVVTLATLGVLLVILLVAALVVPMSLDLPKLRQRITTALSGELGGQVTCAALRLSMLPSPAAVLTDVVVSVPNTVEAKLPSVSVSPRLLSLLRGKLEVGTIRLRAPEIKLHRVLLDGEQTGRESDSTGGFRSRAASALAALSSVATSPAAGAIVVIEDGRAEVSVGSPVEVRFEHIGARVVLPPDRIAVAMSCASNLWDHVSVSTSIDPQSGEGQGRLEVIRLRPEAIDARWLPQGLKLGGSLNFTADVSTHGVHALHAELDGSIPALTVRRGPGEFVMHSQRLGATLDIEGDATRVKLQKLQLDDPRVQLSGSLSMAPDAVSLDVAAADVDVDSVRRVAPVIAGEVPVMRAIFNVLRGGTVPQITLRSQAPSLAALGADQALRIEGRVADARVHLPGVNLDLDGVTGGASVVDGILVGEQISAHLGKSQATDGRLRVGLSGNKPELHVDTQVQADAADLTALLKRLVRNEAFLRESERVSDVTGTVSGHLLLDGTTRNVAVTADASAFSVTGRVEGLRSPLQIEGGYFRFDPHGVEARDVSLATGRSKLSEVALRILPSFEAVAGASQIALDEVYPWLRVSGWLPESRWNPAALRGTLSLQSLHLDRVSGVRGGWQFDLRGSAEKLVIESAQLQQRIAIQYPISLSDLRLRHDTEAGTAFAAKVVASNNLRGAIDLVWSGDRLDIKDLSVHDAQSDASLALFLAPQDLSLKFKGRLTKATLDGLIENDMLAGFVRGDISAQIRRDQSTRAVHGRLEAQDVAVPLRGGRRLRIESVVLEGATDGLSGNAIVDTPEGIRMHLRGIVKQSPKALDADVDLTTGRLDWSAIEPWLSQGEGGARAEAPEVWGRPLRGKVRVAAEAFSYRKFTWEPVRAVVTFAPGGLAVTVSDAKVCGVSTPGSIDIAPPGVTLAAKPVAKNQDLQTLGQCLGLRNEPYTGQYSLAAEVTARGAAADLLRTIQGPVNFHAENGRLYGMGVTARVLSFLSIATGAVGDIANLTREGLPYDAITVTGDLKNGILVLKEATLNGPSVKWAAEGSVDLPARTLDLTLLVAPLKTVDTVVSRIPIISGILGGSLVSIPVHVTGPFEDPTVTPLPPSAVGKGLFNVMKRTFKLPMKVIQPLLPD